MAHRYYTTTLPPAAELELAGELAHHLLRVLRVRLGEVLPLGDGQGRTADATVRWLGKDRLVVATGEVQLQAPPLAQLWLAVAAPRWQRAEWLFEHGTEVGVDVFQPLRSDHSRPQGDRLPRWQKLIQAAAGQCDRAYWPTLLPPQPLLDWLQHGTLPAARFLGAAGAPTFRAGEAGGGDAVLLVGPEGGWSAAEQGAALAAGFQPRSLGPHILRTETAALVGAALLGNVAMARGSRAFTKNSG